MTKRFIKLLLSLSLITTACLPSGMVAAQNLNQACDVDSDSALCQDHEANPAGAGVTSLPSRIAALISIVAGVAGVAMIVIGGFRYVRSSGDPSKLSEAQNTIIFALVGLAVAATARLLITFVLNRTPTP